jgi:hypothetical protein
VRFSTFEKGQRGAKPDGVWKPVCIVCGDWFCSLVTVLEEKHGLET